jgi:hypothetical protein
MITMVTGCGIGVPVVTRAKLDEIEVPFWVSARVASAGAAVRPTNNGPGVYVLVMSTTKAFAVSPDRAAGCDKTPIASVRDGKTSPVETVMSVTKRTE